MKNSKNRNALPKKYPTHKSYPENKDDLDSRKNKEDGYEGKPNKNGDLEK